MHAYAPATCLPIFCFLTELLAQHLDTTRLVSPACRLIWALVHSTTRSNQQRGLELAHAALDNDQRSQDQDRELRYYQSGGQHAASSSTCQSKQQQHVCSGLGAIGTCSCSCRHSLMLLQLHAQRDACSARTLMLQGRASKSFKPGISMCAVYSRSYSLRHDVFIMHPVPDPCSCCFCLLHLQWRCSI
jgi:hypothetical protein